MADWMVAYSVKFENGSYGFGRAFAPQSTYDLTTPANIMKFEDELKDLVTKETGDQVESLFLVSISKLEGNT